MLYKPFHHIVQDIRDSAAEFIINWQTFRPFYKPWHQHRTLSDIESVTNDTSTIHETNPPDTMEINEWELLSQLHPTNELFINDLDMLGLRGFDDTHNWNHTTIPLDLQNNATQFIENNYSIHRILQTHQHILTTLTTLSPMQRKALNIISNHFSRKDYLPALRMIIQSTAGTGKSLLINCIKDMLISLASPEPSPIMLLAPTGVAAFNIQASTIHSTLHLPMNDLMPLQGNALAKFQEELRHIRYILIDEMSFIGPKLLSHIDERLREAFPRQRNTPFGGCSIILVGDLSQLPPVKDIPIYAGTSHGSALWNTFNSHHIRHNISSTR